MRYVTTNIRLPEDLWKEMKIEAARQGKRLADIIRGRLMSALPARKATQKKPRSLCGILKGVEIPESLFEEAKRSLFPPPEEKFPELFKK